MMEKPITIADVIVKLEEIKKQYADENSPLCLFPALYKKVTEAVRDKIAEGNYFDDNIRMEALDVAFANRYIEAWEAWQKKGALSDSWRVSFEIPGKRSLLILQHLLLGMNAHINLDLGIAAFEVSKNQGLESLKPDFIRINKILGSMMDDVQAKIAKHSPWLGMVDTLGGQLDEAAFAFSMERARDFAWILACELQELPGKQDEVMQTRDAICATIADKIIHPGLLLGLGVFLASWRESADYKLVINSLE